MSTWRMTELIWKFEGSLWFYISKSHLTCETCAFPTVVKYKHLKKTGILVKNRFIDHNMKNNRAVSDEKFSELAIRSANNCVQPGDVSRLIESRAVMRHNWYQLCCFEGSKDSQYDDDAFLCVGGSWRRLKAKHMNSRSRNICGKQTISKIWEKWRKRVRQQQHPGSLLVLSVPCEERKREIKN